MPKPDRSSLFGNQNNGTPGSVNPALRYIHSETVLTFTTTVGLFYEAAGVDSFFSGSVVAK